MSKTKAYCEECNYEELYDNYGEAKNNAMEHYYDTEHRARIQEVEE